MRQGVSKRACLAVLCAGLVPFSLAAPAQGAASDPLFVFTPASSGSPKPPPTGSLNGPCGITVDSTGRYYVSDYYHHAVDVFIAQTFVSQIANVDPTGGPCGLALDGSILYVNDYHHNVMQAPPSGAVFDSSAPTGVAVDASGNVYVDDRTYIAEYDSSGTPIRQIGLGTLGDGYSVAVSQYSGTEGRIYVPDASTNTVKVYDPATSTTTPVAELKDPFNKPFSSLRDSAIAVDKGSGTVYFADDQQPAYTEQPQATIYAYTPTNLYAGHLKYNVIDARPPGLAVDNSPGATQGRVYVTSGNTSPASIYAYGPGSATFSAPLPPLGSGLSAPGAAGGSGVAAASAATAQGAPTPPPASTSTITQKENLRIAVTGKLSPKKLPREGSAPISVTVGWQIATTNESPPPRLKTLRIEINRNGHFDYAGLPTCPYAKIQPATTQRALSNCRSALVGQGSFNAEIALKGQEGESYETAGRLLVFNGENKGKPVLFGQIYSAHPFATSFVIVFEVQKIAKGPYGTALAATLPKTLRSWGNLTGIDMKLSRRYGFKGKSRSYLSAGCPAPKGFGLASFRLARTSFDFAGGAKLTSTLTGSCKVR